MSGTNTEPVSELEDLHAINDLAAQLYRQIAKNSPSNSNVIFSAPSAIINLYDVFNAAKGKTKEELEKLFNISSRLFNLQNILTDTHKIFEDGHVLKKTKDRDYDFLGASKILVGKNVQGFNTGIRGFMGENILERIDDSNVERVVGSLTSSLTQDRISGVLSEDIGGKIKKALAEKNSLALYSTAHFFSDWESQFLETSSNQYPDRSRELFTALTGTVEPFHNQDGSASNVIMLHLQGRIFLTRDEDLKVTIAELPLTKYSMNFTIVLPDDEKNGLSNFEGKFDHTTLEILRKNWSMPETHVYLPKFALDNHLLLSKPLSSLGVKSLFSTSAELPGLGGAGSGIHVSEAIHVAGIEISAETGEKLPPRKSQPGECSIMTPAKFPTGFRVDRPFFFFVTARHPEVWCVMGKVVNLPSELNDTVWNHHKQPREEKYAAS